MKTILDEGTCFPNEIQLSAGANHHQVSCLKLKQKVLDVLGECDFFERHQHQQQEVGCRFEARPQRLHSIECRLQHQQLHQADSQAEAKHVHLIEEAYQQDLKQEVEEEEAKEVEEAVKGGSAPSEMEILQTQPSSEIASQERQRCMQLNICAAAAATAHHHQQQLQAQSKSTGLYQAPTAPTSQPQSYLISSHNNHHHHHHLLNRHNQKQQQQRQQQPQQRLPPPLPLLAPPVQPPKIYPNNTLVEDLTRCHDNLLPKVTRATARTIELFRSCLPNKSATGGASICAKRAAAKRRDKLAAATTTSQQLENGLASNKSVIVAGYVNNNIVLSHDDSDQSNCDNCPPARLAPQLVAPQVGPARARRRAKKFQMPDSIVKLNSTLNQDDYNRALSILTNDVRYQLHLLLYRRLQTIWTLFTTIVCILIPVLCVAHLEMFVILGSCLLWLGLQAAGAALTQQSCKKLDQMLEKAVAQVNSYFMDHNLMLGVINVGGMLTRARLVIPLLYFDTIQCREQIESIISVDLRKESDAGDKEQQQQQLQQQRGQSIKRERKFALDYSKIGLQKIGPESQMSFAQSQLAKKIILRYSQRWISYFDKRKLMFNDDKVEPRHLSTGKCLCQFIEEHFKYDELDLDEAGGDGSVAGDEDGTQQQLATAKAVARGEQQAAAAATADNQSKEFAANMARPMVGNMANGKKNDNLDDELDAALNLAAPIDPRKITPLGALLLQNGHTNGSNNISSSQQLDMLVPTLSQLVDMKERQEQFRISMDIGFSQQSAAQQQQQQQQPNGNCYASKLIHSFTTHLQQERLDSTSSPTTEHSFDLTDAGDLLPSSSNRNDELMRRLKSLLESRKNEFSRGLADGNSAMHAISQYNSSNNAMNNYVSYSSRPLPTTGAGAGDKSIQTQDSNGGSTQTINQTNEANSGGGGSSSTSSRMSQLGKKFFSQADGIFFMGAKKSQQGVYAKQQQVLEIC